MMMNDIRAVLPGPDSTKLPLNKYWKGPFLPTSLPSGFFVSLIRLKHTMSHTAGITTLNNLDNTLGAMLIGTLFSMALWGVTCTQTYDYFMNNTDGRLQKSIVALLWMIDTLSSAMHAHMIYHYSISSYGNLSNLLKANWSVTSLSLVSGISNFIIRAMFARRIYQFGRRNTLLTTWIVFISTCDLVVAIVTTAKAYQGINPVIIQSISKLMYISFGLGVTADLSVTIGLSWLLHSAKSGFPKSDFVVNVLMAYVVNTGLLVTVTATVALITYVVMPDNNIFLAFFILLSKLYLNAYLSTLNARGRLRAESDSGVPLSRLGVSSSQGRDTQGVSSSANEKMRPFSINPAMSISFQKTVERRVDDVGDEVKQPSHAV